MEDDSNKSGADSQGQDNPQDKGHPESVSWSQYVGLKEKFNKVEADLKGKVGSLEENLKKAVSPEELAKTKGELEQLKGEHTRITEELKGIKEKSLSEKREILIKKGVSEEELKGLSEKELDTVSKVVGGYKPKPDLGSGGGSGGLKGSPMELARQAYVKQGK